MRLRSFTLVPDHVVKSEAIRTNSEANLPIARAIEALAEAQARKLHLADGYASMREFCVCEMNLSEDEAAKRLQVARAVHDFPGILPMLADGRLHQTAVVMLAPHLKQENAGELLAASAHRTKSQIALLLAERFPRPDIPTSIHATHAPGCAEAVPSSAPGGFTLVSESALTPTAARTWNPVPTSPGRFAVQFTLDDEAHRELEYARSLHRRAVPSGDVAEFYRWAVQQAIKLGEKRAFGATTRRRPNLAGAAPEPKGSRIPDALREQVWMRDGGRCTFLSEAGRRCSAEGVLDVDHIVPLARQGRTTLDNLRLLCPGHNQYEADRILGAGFMAQKRASGREVDEVRSPDVNAPSQTQVPEPVFSTTPEHVAAQEANRAQRDEIVPYLRRLGFRVEQARWAATMCDPLVGQTLETRVKFALQQLGRARFERATVRPTIAAAAHPSERDSDCAMTSTR